MDSGPPDRILESTQLEEATMTIDTVPAAAVPSVFDAGLPSLDYLQMQDPEDAHRAIADARRQSPIALGAPGNGE